MSRERDEIEAAILFELHRLYVQTSQLAHEHAASSEITGRDLEGLLAIWDAQLAEESIGFTDLVNKSSSCSPPKERT